MKEKDSDAKKEFDEAGPDEYLDKLTTCAGLGIKKSLLDSKAIHGDGPRRIKDGGKLFYKKSEAIEWHLKYSAELANKKEKLKVAVFSMANERQGNW